MRATAGLLSTVVAIALAAPSANGDAATALPGNQLALKSGGSAADGGGWTLDGPGFLGTYVVLDAPGRMTISVHASGRGALALVTGDSRAPFDVDSPGTKFTNSFDLPAGTHFVRIEQRSATPDRSLTIRSISVDGAKVRNEHSDANALAAADTYIANSRRGRATVTLVGATAQPGALVHVKLKRHSFNFGTAVAGFDRNELFVPDAPPEADAARYQRAVLDHFNAIVPGNAGKWAYNEKDRDAVTMQYIDALRDFARDHGLRMRMHTLLWATGQQPEWVTALLNSAANGDVEAKLRLRGDVSKRIGYYVRDRAASYDEIDILNEPLHEPKYWQTFGPEGIADMYREAAAALAGTPASKPRLFVNEYNVLQYSSRYPFKDGGPDPYANWYREHAEALIRAGAPLGGIGVQYYAFTEPNIPSPHSAARIHAVFQNLSVTGLPLALTEFGVKSGSDLSRVPQILDETVRLTFGTPGATGFFMWGFWKTELWDQARGAAFYDDRWQATPARDTWQQLMSRWTTDETVRIGDDRCFTFSGFHGEYEITIDGVSRPLTFENRKSKYSMRFP